MPGDRDARGPRPLHLRCDAHAPACRAPCRPGCAPLPASAITAARPARKCWRRDPWAPSPPAYHATRRLAVLHLISARYLLNLNQSRPRDTPSRTLAPARLPECRCWAAAAAAQGARRMRVCIHCLLLSAPGRSACPASCPSPAPVGGAARPLRACCSLGCATRAPGRGLCCWWWWSAVQAQSEMRTRCEGLASTARTRSRARTHGSQSHHEGPAVLDQRSLRSLRPRRPGLPASATLRASVAVPPAQVLECLRKPAARRTW